MSLVHKQSKECAKSELDLFDVPPTQTSFESARVVEYYPISNLDNGPIEFFISGSSEEYLDLSQAFLHVQARIVTSANGTPVTDQVVAPVNLFLHSMFSQVDVALNETYITSSVNTYPYRCMFENLLNYGKDAKNSYLQTSLYYEDDAGAMDSISLDGTVAKMNSGFCKRNAMVLNRNFDMYGRLHVDMFLQDRLIINNVNVKVKLFRAKDSFCLMGANNAYKVEIRKAVLSIRKVKVNPKIMLAHAAVLEKSTLKYPIRRVETKYVTITSGLTSKTLDNVSIGTLPKRVVFGLVTSAAYDGAIDKNPFNFNHFNLSKVSMSIDGEEAPYSPVEVDFTNGLYAKAYYSLFTGIDKVGLDAGNNIDYFSYGNGYTLFAFDLTPDTCNNSCYFNLVKNGNMRISLNFAQALQNNINCVIYLEYENIIEINKSRQILFDYKI
jgi:hypothetical protein